MPEAMPSGAGRFHCSSKERANGDSKIACGGSGGPTSGTEEPGNEVGRT